MTHKCIKCDRRFPTSGKMVQHMRESHSSFVENAQMKIDRSEEGSFEAKKAAKNVNSAAQCPTCKLDCRTRKKLVRHMETEHKEVDNESGPELKIIRLGNESKDKILDEIQKEQSEDSTLQPQKTKVVKNLINAVGSKDGESEVVLPGSKSTIQVSATSIKLLERKYRCFWCAMAFRKRGKLMDHIDLFHKMSKEQTEVEAEKIHVSVVENETVTPAVSTKEKKSTSQSSSSKKQKQGRKKKQKTTQTQKQSSIFINSVDLECPETPNNNVCKFLLSASITEISRVTLRKMSMPESNNATSCKFFNRKEDNPLPPAQKIELEKATVPEKTDTSMGRYSPPSYMPLFSPDQPETYHTSNIGMQPRMSYMPMQPSYLSSSQPLPNITNSAFHAYQQQLVSPQSVPTFYLGQPLQQRREQNVIPMEEYQHNSQGYDYRISTVAPETDFDSPLDLTLPKYRWKKRIIHLD